MAKILLAEDDESMRRFLASALEKAGHEVASFSQGDEAFDCLRDGNRFVASGRRLYYTDMSLRLYCLEEDRSAVPVEPPRAPAAARRRKA